MIGDRPLMLPVNAPTSFGEGPMLMLVDGSAQSRDPDAVDYLRSSGLPLSSVVLALFDQSDDCIKVITNDGSLQFMNCNGRQAMEVDDFGAIAGCRWDTMWPADSQSSVSEAVSRAKLGYSSRFEAFCPTAKGTPRWWDVSVSPIMTDSGEVEAILSSSRDITQRKIDEQSKEVMLDEMKHRLRNAYAIGSAIAMACAREQPEHLDFATAISGRLGSVAAIQTAMVDTGGACITDIVKRIVQSFDSHAVATINDLPTIRLAENEARALGLVIGELSTNSLKHGSLGGRGTLTISAEQDGEMLHIDWIERHTTVRRSGTTASSGLGNSIMSTMLRVVGGALDNQILQDGYRARLTMRAPFA